MGGRHVAPLCFEPAGGTRKEVQETVGYVGGLKELKLVLDELVHRKFEERDKKTGQNLGNTIFTGWVEKKSTEGSKRNDQGRDEGDQESGHMKPRGRWWSLAPVANGTRPVHVVGLCFLASLVGTALAHKFEQQLPQHSLTS